MGVTGVVSEWVVRGIKTLVIISLGFCNKLGLSCAKLRKCCASYIVSSLIMKLTCVLFDSSFIKIGSKFNEK